MSTAQTAIKVVKSGIMETIYSIILSIPLFHHTRCGAGNIEPTLKVKLVLPISWVKAEAEKVVKYQRMRNKTCFIDSYCHTMRHIAKK